MKLYFVRHGKTLGNREGRYVGCTDEPLLSESIENLSGRKVPAVELVVASPMLRCRQTAQALYPGTALWIQEELREMDFGAFEYKNYEELKGNLSYQAYIDSGGTLDFPGGEPVAAFKERCKKGFLEAVERAGALKLEQVAFVVHGGTIMAVLEAYGEPKRGYFDWQISNGEILAGHWDGRSIRLSERLGESDGEITRF